MNINRFVLLSTFFFLILGAKASIRESWERMPDSMLINKEHAEVITENNVFMHVSVSSALDVQLRLMNLASSGEVLCCVRTYSAPDKESVVELYDKEWNLIRRMDFSLSDILGQENSLKYKDLFCPQLISATLHDSSDDVTLTLSDKFLSEEDKELLKGISLQRNVNISK